MHLKTEAHPTVGDEWISSSLFCSNTESGLKRNGVCCCLVMVFVARERRENPFGGTAALVPPYLD